MKEIFNFSENNNYNLRTGTHLQHILEQSPLQILEQKYGNLYHKILKKLAPCLSLKVKKWIPQNCPCHLCKTHIAQVGFI